MTISSILAKANYVGNGSTTAFAITFKYLATTDIVVTLVTDATDVEVVQVVITDYTITAAGDTGTITMIVAPASGETLIIERIMAFTQSTDYVENDAFPAESHEEALDRLTMIVQQLKELVDRTPQLTISTLLAGLSIEEPVADKGLIYNPTGDGIINGGDAADIAAAGANATAAAISAAAAAAFAGGFAAGQQAVPDMTVLVAGGQLFVPPKTFTLKTSQNSATITAPSTDPRIDRIAILISTGAVVVITGTEAPSPVALAYLTDHFPVCQIALVVSQTSILTADITDERCTIQRPHYLEGTYTAALTATTSGTITLNTAADLLSFTKIGQIVFVQGNILVLSVASPLGGLRLSVPFNIKALAENASQAACSVLVNNATVDIPPAGSNIQGNPIASTTLIQIRTKDRNANTSIDTYAANMQALTNIDVNFHYITDA